jgi:hypothetical protein
MMIRRLYGLRIPSPERHDRGAPRVLELLRRDRIVVRVGQDGEALLREDARRLDEPLHVREERAAVADHLELHEIAHLQLAPEPRRADRLLGGEARGGVGEELHPLRDPLEQRLGPLLRQVEAAYRDRH